MPKLHCEVVYSFGLADVVMSSAHHVHISVRYLSSYLYPSSSSTAIPIPGYWGDIPIVPKT